MKAVLAAHAIDFRRTHDLVDLADVLAESGIVLPDDLRQLDVLNPFAVEARYDFLPASSALLDRPAMRRQIASLRPVRKEDGAAVFHAVRAEATEEVAAIAGNACSDC